MRHTTWKQSTRWRIGSAAQLSHRPGVAARRIVAMLPLVAVVGVLVAFGGGQTAAPAGWDEAEPGPASPIANWLEDLIDDIEDAADNLDDAEATVAEQQGPLTGTDLTAVGTDLYDALAIIDRILDPMQYPSLNPTDAGEIDYSVSPSTLPKYAAKCVELIQEALAEARFGAADDVYIGSRLKTIEHLITRSDPHNYKSKAGVQ